MRCDIVYIYCNMATVSILPAMFGNDRLAGFCVGRLGVDCMAV
jgi:hypothetical protein